MARVSRPFVSEHRLEARFEQAVQDPLVINFEGNGWIDTRDSIYDRLRVWMRDPQGNDQLIALGELGIGAIYLGHVATPFAVKDKENRLQAQVRSSGIYLTQDGAAGTVQHLDLVV